MLRPFAGCYLKTQLIEVAAMVKVTGWDLGHASLYLSGSRQPGEKARHKAIANNASLSLSM
jgi:hypothetical protein